MEGVSVCIHTKLGRDLCEGLWCKGQFVNQRVGC